MTTSGSVDFTLNRVQLVRSALRLCRIIGEKQEPTIEQLVDATEALNVLLKAWVARGRPIWKLSRETVSMVAGTAEYTLGPATSRVMPKAIVQAFVRDSNNQDIAVVGFSEDEYNRQPAKGQEADAPTHYHYKPGRLNGSLYLYPTPNGTAAAKTLYVVTHGPFEDMDSPTDDFDFPPEWLRAIKYNLASDIGPEFGVPLSRQDWLKREAVAALEEVEGADREETVIQFIPDLE